MGTTKKKATRAGGFGKRHSLASVAAEQVQLGRELRALQLSTMLEQALRAAYEAHPILAEDAETVVEYVFAHLNAAVRSAVLAERLGKTPQVVVDNAHRALQGARKSFQGRSSNNRRILAVFKMLDYVASDPARLKAVQYVGGGPEQLRAFAIWNEAVDATGPHDVPLTFVSQHCAAFAKVAAVWRHTKPGRRAMGGKWKLLAEAFVEAGIRVDAKTLENRAREQKS